MDLSSLETSSPPVTRTASSMSYGQNLDRLVCYSIDHRIWETAKKIFSCAVRMLRPTCRIFSDAADSVVESSHEGIGRGWASFGIPAVSRLCLCDGDGMRSNSWRGHRIARGFGGEPLSRKLSLLFPDPNRRCGVRSLCSRPIRHLHRRHYPNFPASDPPARHGLQWVSVTLLRRPFGARVSCTQSNRLSAIRQSQHGDVRVWADRVMK
jgi:hypothetical protein